MWWSMRPTLKRTLTPGESANIAKSALDARDQRTQQRPITGGSPISRGAKELLSTASASLATQGLNEQISREKGVKKLFVERTISIRRARNGHVDPLGE